MRYRPFSPAVRARRRETLPRPALTGDLPVLAAREEILSTLSRHPVTIICGETGSGKTTQIPQLCLLLERGVEGLIGCTQPRRVAARSVAQRLAQELGTRLGEAVGYQVRFHDQVSDRSFIKVMTEGILLAEIAHDPDLRRYDTLILDEVHERSLNMDFLMGYLKGLLPRRPDLKVVLTSATLEAERLSAHFDQAPVIEVSGRTWPVEIRWRPIEAPSEGETDDDEDRDLQALLDAVDELGDLHARGDILIFLPGERDIRQAAEALRKHHPPHTEILPLYARQSQAEQDRVFQTGTGRRIVLATNVAETSLTVPGIHFVIDTGLARVNRYSLRRSPSCAWKRSHRQRPASVPDVVGEWRLESVSDCMTKWTFPPVRPSPRLKSSVPPLPASSCVWRIWVWAAWIRSPCWTVLPHAPSKKAIGSCMNWVPWTRPARSPG